MKHIIKKQTVQAHELLDGFLERNKSRHNGVYTDDLFANLGADYCPPASKTKKKLADIILAEQEGRCCYCMRNIAELDSQERNLEHAIVNHPVNLDEYNLYLDKGSSLDSAPIEPSSTFLIKQAPPPPYPHSIAYENLLVLCAGHLHVASATPLSCNCKRVHHYVAPLQLMKDIEQEIIYLHNGLMVWINETNTNTPSIEVLGLNNQVLKIIRRLWYNLSRDHLNPQNCNKDEVIYNVLSEMLDDNESDSAIQTLFLFQTNSWYWDLLRQFDYFNDVNRFVSPPD